MNYRSSSTHRDSWVHTVLGDQNFQAQKGFFAWWYRHTCPPDPSPGASFQQRDRVRRGRIASACMLFLALILVLVAVIAFVGPNRQIATIIYTLYPMIVLCVVLNRRGMVTLVGVLLTLGIVGGMCLTLVTTALRGGLSPNDKDILYLLFFAELFVAAILPIHWVFVVAVLGDVRSCCERLQEAASTESAQMMPSVTCSLIGTHSDKDSGEHSEQPEHPGEQADTPGAGCWHVAKSNTEDTMRENGTDNAGPFVTKTDTLSQEAKEISDARRTGSSPQSRESARHQ